MKIKNLAKLQFISGAIIRTKDLFTAIDIYGKERISDNAFKYIEFDTLKRHEYPIWRLKNKC